MSDSANHLDPEPETPDHEQYFTYARREVINMIDEIIDNRCSVTVYFNQGEERFVTNLLHVNPDFEELVFDAAPADAISRRVAESKGATFVTFLDQIKVQFNAQRIEVTTFEGRPALRTRLPESMMRLQRRNFYRVPAPIAKPLQCTIALPSGATAQFAIRDISVGGLAMLADRPRPNSTPAWCSTIAKSICPATAALPSRWKCATTRAAARPASASATAASSSTSAAPWSA